MLKEILARVIRQEDLSEEEMIKAMTCIMEGNATEAQTGSFLTALKMKGETVNEIAGAARVMRNRSLKVNFNAPVLIDICGTGGDGANSFNISSTVAFIVASAGINVAKHGNRAVSGRCGSADLFEALSIKIDLSPEEVEESMKKTGMGFMFAPVFHRAMKHAAKTRTDLGFRTIFNLLGPLTNPAGVNCQLTGVYAPELTEPVAEVMKKLGVKRAMVVHGSGGIDELSLEGKNRITFLNNGHIKTFTFDAAEAGMKRSSNSSLKGGNASENACLTEAILNGSHRGPAMDAVLLNAAAALIVAERADDFRDGIKISEDLISRGKAVDKLNQIRKLFRRR